MLIALIPAHNEEHCIANAIAGLKAQTVQPDAIAVIGDNCTDRTLEIAALNHAETVATLGNRDKKAGALNQILRTLLPRMADTDLILVTDADSKLDPGFIEHALKTLSNPKYGGVGGTFRGDPGGGFVGHLQRNEYARYARDVRRLRGKCLVITGTAAVFPVKILREISAARLMDGTPPSLPVFDYRGVDIRKADPRLPAGDGQGGIYDTSVLTEDNELSFAIMTLGYKIHAPIGCTLTTEVMPTWRDLWRQRVRWKRGAIENCIQYGVTRVTARYWGRQIFSAMGVAVSTLYLTFLSWSAIAGTMTIQPLWMSVTGVFILERVITVKDRGWKQMFLSATMYEMFYDLFLQTAQAKAFIDSARRTKKEW